MNFIKYFNQDLQGYPQRMRLPVVLDYVDWNSFLSVFTFTILFINTSKINMKGKDRSNFKFVIFEEFYVVVEVASFVGIVYL